MKITMICGPTCGCGKPYEVEANGQEHSCPHCGKACGRAPVAVNEIAKVRAEIEAWLRREAEAWDNMGGSRYHGYAELCRCYANAISVGQFREISSATKSPELTEEP